MDKHNPTEVVQSVLNRIKKEDIKPKSRLSFLIKNYSIWFFGVLSLLVGSLAFSVLIYMEKNNDWQFYKRFNDSLVKFIFTTLSYFWLIAFIIFIVIAYYNLKHTKKGYKHTMSLVISGSLTLTMVLGIVFYNLGISKLIDDELAERTSIYPRFINPRVNMWMQPEKGMLTGAVFYIQDPEVFVLKDLRGKDWNVNYNQAVIFPEVQLVEGEKINLLGKQLGQMLFEAERIVPVGPGVRFHEKVIKFHFNSNCPERNASSSFICPNIAK